ncbi:hypothetical protein Ga0074812_14941 [Parafrankia irregularis]|uniref:Uncharacterized protein n=1 Tax=Parafrankia irregularis TaxID=795642 RepID=A0A0S4QZ30_9ACTN|nr:MULTISPECIES: hypothetical protein [Frankiaceae]KPM50320.1 hypothetical protein ACG83_41005 [Frankia sp. R43]MBE3204699.1 hypothetical protein [Parafrankia sp. CH37]CUU60897.1 hypothetical protein Ga0074812_14941 [Parafrankia irregularis]
MPAPRIAVFPHPEGVYYAHLVDPILGINAVGPTPHNVEDMSVEEVAFRLRKLPGNEYTAVRPFRTTQKWITYAEHEGHLEAITEALGRTREGVDHDAAR